VIHTLKRHENVTFRNVTKIEQSLVFVDMTMYHFRARYDTNALRRLTVQCCFIVGSGAGGRLT
jgi:hypothetical protein